MAAGPDPPIAGRVDRLPLPGAPVLVTYTGLTCCWTLSQKGLFEAGATFCISPGRPLEGGTILFELSSLAWIGCLQLHSAGRECVGL